MDVNCPLHSPEGSSRGCRSLQEERTLQKTCLLPWARAGFHFPCPAALHPHRAHSSDLHRWRESQLQRGTAHSETEWGFPAYEIWIRVPNTEEEKFTLPFWTYIISNIYEYQSVTLGTHTARHKNRIHSVIIHLFWAEIFQWGKVFITDH